MIEQLASSVIVQLDFGSVEATHRAVCVTLDPIQKLLRTVTTLGVEVNGVFKPIPGTSEQIDIQGDDFDTNVDSVKLTIPSIALEHDKRVGQRKLELAEVAARREAELAELAEIVK